MYSKRIRSVACADVRESVAYSSQPWSKNLTEHPQMWQNVGSYGNVFGLEPDYVSAIPSPMF